jgi:AcrR family transcriptional regulator
LRPCPIPTDAARGERSDARRNREALTRAARAVFAAHGLDAALEQVARDAGVSIGTLYRHFPTRVDLARAVFTDWLENLFATAERAAALPDASAGFRLYVEAHCELQAEDRGFDDLTGMRLPNSSPWRCARRYATVTSKGCAGTATCAWSARGGTRNSPAGCWK